MYEVEGSDFDAIAEEMGKIAGVQSAEIAKMDLVLRIEFKFFRKLSRASRNDNDKINLIFL